MKLLGLIRAVYPSSPNRVQDSHRTAIVTPNVSSSAIAVEILTSSAHSVTCACTPLTIVCIYSYTSIKYSCTVKYKNEVGMRPCQKLSTKGGTARYG